MQTTTELTQVSGMIFTGTVVQRGTSLVAQVPAAPELMTVSIDRGLRVDPVHGDLSGKLITVVPASPEGLAVGQRAVFFTNSWIHGQGIAVREVAHLDVADEDSAVRAVAELPTVHLLDRLRSAQLVVRAQVVGVHAVERTSFARNNAIWAAAELKIVNVLRGTRVKTATVYFPTSNHPMWASAPRFEEAQRGVFVLHAATDELYPSETGLPSGRLVALDPADVQPEAQLDQIEQLLGTIK